MVCSEYEGCFIPFHKCLLSLIVFCLPFNDFEMSVMNNLMIAPLQLHLVSWAFAKVFQYWCEYKGGKQIMALFVHIFKTQNNTDNHACGLGLTSLRKTLKFFKTYSNHVKHFRDHFVLVTPLNEEAHVKICKIELEPSYVCTYLFNKL